MAITYHAGRRIQGTSTDFGTAGAGIPAVSGGWKELGRTTLGTAGTTLDLSSIPDKRYYMLLFNPTGLASASGVAQLRFNADSGTSYAWRRNNDGAGEVGAPSQTDININSITNAIGGTEAGFGVAYIANLASKEKLLINHDTQPSASGAGTAPNRQEYVGKWTNTSDPIDQMQIISSSANYLTGSEMVVLGWDPADTHTDNFWEELASVSGSTASNLSTGTFTAKKYLWVQIFLKPSAAYNPYFHFNNDTATNYSYRFSDNGGADGTSTSQNHLLAGNNVTGTMFGNYFIINNSANEKLVIGTTTINNTAGAGTATTRREIAEKWSNTSSQITEIDIDPASGVATLGSESIIKVWGSD
jgi:hypothetical protein